MLTRCPTHCCCGRNEWKEDCEINQHRDGGREREAVMEEKKGAAMEEGKGGSDVGVRGRGGR